MRSPIHDRFGKEGFSPAVWVATDLDFNGCVASAMKASKHYHLRCYCLPTLYKKQKKKKKKRKRKEKKEKDPTNYVVAGGL